MDHGMLGMMWHRQSDGSAQSSLSLGSAGRQMTTVQVLSFLCYAPKQCVCLLPELSVCMWRGRSDVWLWSTVPWVSIEQKVIQMVLSPVCYWRQTQRTQTLSASWGWPFSPTQHNLHKKKEEHSRSGRGGRSKNLWQKFIQKWIIQLLNVMKTCATGCVWILLSHCFSAKIEKSWPYCFCY